MPVQRGMRPGVLAAIVLGVVAMALLAVMVVAELRERAGKDHAVPGKLTLPTVDAAPTAQPTTLVPSAVVLPAPTAPSEPIAPLQPSPAPSGGRGGR
jgi:hypothetical protein